ncbi:MAG: DNA mismatch repair endonuclease MutL [Oscillospiraceae bacterium]|nr:DNA mismatch repair endonuclease MutL [Oscillospiraceae bacterium]
MPDIQILSPHLADLIAAGEVVERPASVVKELVENAFDAGARTVTVELRGGGATYLRVTDDGCGMAPEDAGIAFLRHATSKLHDEQGLEAIGTMGFRGEALAAISAVSHITLTTRQRGAAAGTHMTLDAGDIQDMYETGCPEGTTMIVRDLFFNTPARRKFLKSDRAEGAACAAAALRCALGRPDVSVRCIRDGEEVFFSPGDNKLDSCVYSLLGRDLAMSLLPCAGEADGVRVHGFISSPAAGRGSRAQQYFFCNGRWIRSAALQAALEQAYRNTLLVGRFPACVLYIELSCAAVDVNVHPAKTEVKFTHERAVFDAVYYGARAALEAEREPVTTLPKAVKPEPAPKADPFVPSAPKAAPAQHPSAPAPAAPAFAPARTYAPAVPAEEAVAFRSPTASAFAAPRVAPPPAFVTPARPAPGTLPEPVVPVAQPAQTAIEQEPVIPSPLESAVPPAEPPARLIGEAMHTYILVEKGETLILIDKHAAHERINFDRMRQSPADIPSQTLLEPLPFTPDASDADVLQQYGGLLAELGFTLEPFGRCDYILRGVPAQLDAADALPALEEICAQLRHGAQMDAQSVRDEVLKTVACKAAIKAGWQTEPEELLRLADAVCAGEVKYCPHGRPVAVTLTRRELDKLFKRIV